VFSLFNNNKSQEFHNQDYDSVLQEPDQERASELQEQNQYLKNRVSRCLDTKSKLSRTTTLVIVSVSE